MFLPLGQFSPDIKIGLVSASRNCFPRALAESRTKRLLAETRKLGLEPFVPDAECAVIETRAHAAEAAHALVEARCDAAVLYLGNFSPEIEDAAFVKAFPGPVMLIAAAEESAAGLAAGRGDALCGLLSATLAIRKRALSARVHIPESPLVSAAAGAQEIAHFVGVLRVHKGITRATLGLFGPRPRDFETVNYNIASILSLGVEIEELGFHDLVNAVEKIEAGQADAITDEMIEQVGDDYGREFMGRLSAYEKALLTLRETLRLSGATTQCWPEQEPKLRHVPCFVNSRLAAQGFPVACENDAYSLVAELMGQYASDADVTVLDINHTIPADLPSGLPDRVSERDVIGMFHCGNTNARRLREPALKHQVIMKRLMEPDTEPDITRGTLEGDIAASPITVLQVHGNGDGLRAYLIEGKFLDVPSQTFGAAGVAYLPGFARFYRHVLLGRFHHHAAVAFDHCAAVLYDALKLLGVEEVFVPFPSERAYPGENVFRS